jgi:hypothetical protein
MEGTFRKSEKVVCMLYGASIEEELKLDRIDSRGFSSTLLPSYYYWIENKYSMFNSYIQIARAIFKRCISTVKSVIFWDMMPRGYCKKRHFVGMYRLQHQGEKNPRAKNSVSSN